MRALKYADITLRPRYSTLDSRANADTSIDFGPKKFKIPIIPANMRAVIDERTARWLSDNNYFYIMHRFDVDPLSFCSENRTLKIVSISVGVQQKDKEDIIRLASSKLRIDYITIDIAHAHSSLVKAMVEHIRAFLPSTYLIAGNVATADAVLDLQKWGVDCIKVGIGQGYVCTTKDKTGFTYPMFSCILECASVARVPIIADGGIQSNGDVAKALCAGATMVMAGSLFSQCLDSPAPTVVIDGRKYKKYYGSASEHNKGHRKNIEGTLKELPHNNMTYAEKCEELQQDLQSSISYAGGSTLKDFLGVKYLEI